MRSLVIAITCILLALASCGGWQAVDTYDDMQSERVGSGEDAGSVVEVTGYYRCDEWGGYLRPREYDDEIWCLSRDGALCRRYTAERLERGDELVMRVRISGIMGDPIEDGETAGCDRRFEVRLVHEIETGRRFVD